MTTTDVLVWIGAAGVGLLFCYRLGEVLAQLLYEWCQHRRR